MNTSLITAEIDTGPDLGSGCDAPVDPLSNPSAQIELLRLLEHHPEHSQRQLAAALGGTTHYLLKALLGKGWVKAQNFKRSDHKVGYLYVLTPQGMGQRLKLTQSFLVRKEREYEMLKSQIVLLREELAAQSKRSS